MSWIYTLAGGLSALLMLYLLVALILPERFS